MLENGLRFSFVTGKYSSILFHDQNFIFQIVNYVTNLQFFFYSWAIVPGSSLMNPTVLAIAYLLALGYLFLGIAIISDIFMEAIESITAQTKAIDLWDKDSKSVSINYHLFIQI